MAEGSAFTKTEVNSVASKGIWSALRHAYSAAERRAVRTLLDFGWLRSQLARSRSAPVDGRVLDVEMAAMLALDDLTTRSDLRGLSPKAARARNAADILVVDASPEGGVTVHDYTIDGPGGPLRVRSYVPDGLPAPSPGVVFIHGGGWVVCSVETHDGFCRRLALGSQCRVMSIDYRLAPEHRYPAAVVDSVAGTRWVLAHAEELGIDPSRVAVAGDSAGGNLSAVIARHTRHDARRLALQVLIYPALDGTFALPSHTTLRERYFLTGPMCEWYYAHYVGNADRRDPDVSPLFGEEPSDIPALIYTTGFDPLRDEGKAYEARLKSAATPTHFHEFESLPHGFILMRGAVRAAREASETVIRDLRDALHDGKFLS
jgi:acetyl esterase